MALALESPEQFLVEWYFFPVAVIYTVCATGALVVVVGALVVVVGALVVVVGALVVEVGALVVMVGEAAEVSGELSSSGSLVIVELFTVAVFASGAVLLVVSSQEGREKIKSAHNKKIRIFFMFFSLYFQKLHL